VMGSGIWSMHFVGMLAFSLPIALGYSLPMTLLSWLAAVSVSALALQLAARERLTPRGLVAGALVMGAGICAMHYLGMAALEMAPGIVWHWGWVAASVLIACAASAGALLIAAAMRRLSGVRAQAAQALAALAMGAAISGMHYSGMAAAGFPADAVCLSREGLGGQGVGTLIALATVLLLGIAIFTSTLDARMQARADALAASLREANDRLQDANAELRRIAFADPLTGVPNRALFHDRLAHAAARVDRATEAGGSRDRARLGLLYIDLDGFKAVNDSDGHGVGDAILREVGQRLKRIARESDTLARLGGDEFVLLMEAVSGPGDAQSAAERVLATLREPFELPHRRVTLSCSIGIGIYPDHGPPERLMVSADAAMYQVKRAGGDGCALFEPGMQQDSGEQLDLQQELRGALDRGELRLHYQPKVDARSGRLAGAEALLRWQHPARGTIGPAGFIPIAERFGLIVRIGEWVIEEACRQIAAWSGEGRPLAVSINLSAHQLRHPELPARVQAALRRHGVDASQLVCEITESVAMEDTPTTQRVIEQLTALGLKLSIDDFGTGYSSLAALRQLRPHELKIDRSFVVDVAANADARAVVDAIVGLAHALGVRVVAEGVETAVQHEALVALGCDALQGFHFGRPVPAPDFPACAAAATSPA
jgi:diguanylate cyclase (GGDEF)-like protein